MGTPLALAIVRPYDGQQARPRYEGVHAREELLALGNLLLRKLGLRKTGLVVHAIQFRKHPTRRF